MHIPRSTLPRLILWGSIGLTLLVLLYLTLPMLLAAWLQHFLTLHGFTQVNLELDRPGLRTLRMREITMTRELGNQRWIFRAHNIDIEYLLGDVLKGRIYSLRIPQASLGITSLPNVSDPAPQVTAIPVPAHWINALPLDVLIVENAEIDWHIENSGTRHARLRGQARKENGKLHSRWSANIPDAVEFKLDIDTEGRLSSILYRSNAPTSPLIRTDVTITPQNNHIAVQGTLQAELDALAVLFAAWLPKSIQPINGSLRATWTGETSAQFSSDVGFQGTLDLNLSDLRVGTVLKGGNLQVNMNFSKRANTWDWHLREGSRFSTQLNPVVLAISDSMVDKGFVRGAKPTIFRAPTGLSGELTFTPLGWDMALAPGKLSIEHVHTPDIRIAKLNLSSLNRIYFRHHSASGQWSSEGLHLTLSAPKVEPELAAIGNIENFSVKIRVAAGALASLPALHIEDIDMLLLGGKVSSRDIQYSRSKNRNDFTLEIKGLDLARVVALEQQQQIEASGTLDGKLPFVLTRDGIRIVDGTLRATPAGGVIRYHATESIQSMAAANPNLKLAVQAFSNYHYQKLDVGVNYSENGDLNLIVAMAGRNPDWNTGQPINLNINLAENIPMLLRSLRSGDDIGAQFQKHADERASP